MNLISEEIISYYDTWKPQSGMNLLISLHSDCRPESISYKTMHLGRSICPCVSVTGLITMRFTCVSIWKSERDLFSSSRNLNVWTKLELERRQKRVKHQWKDEVRWHPASAVHIWDVPQGHVEVGHRFCAYFLGHEKALQRHLFKTVLVILCIVVTFCNSHVDQLSQKDNGCLVPSHVQNNVRRTAIDMHSLFGELEASKESRYNMGSSSTLLKSGKNCALW